MSRGDVKEKPKEKPLFTDSSRCKDFDEDCEDATYLKCWLHAPERGWCPFLINDGDTGA